MASCPGRFLQKKKKAQADNVKYGTYLIIGHFVIQSGLCLNFLRLIKLLEQCMQVGNSVPLQKLGNASTWRDAWASKTHQRVGGATKTRPHVIAGQRNPPLIIRLKVVSEVFKIKY